MKVGSDKKICVFDIDGTISDSTHRLPLIKSKPKNWKAFMELSIHDNPIPQTTWIFHKLVDADDSFTIVMTARSEDERGVTEKWLQKNNFRYDILIMRKRGDNRPDWQAKSDLIDEIQVEYGPIFMAFEDRPGVVTNCYHAKKIFVLDVGNGLAD